LKKIFRLAALMTVSILVLVGCASPTDRFDSALERFNAALAGDDIAGAQIALDEAKVLLPSDARLNAPTQKLTEVQNSKENFEAAKRAASSSQPYEAIEFFVLVSAEDSLRYEQAQEEIFQIISSQISKVSQNAGRQDQEELLLILQSLPTDSIPSTAGLADQIGKISDSYVSSILIEIDSLVSEGSYNNAMATINNSLQVLPTNEGILLSKDKVDKLIAEEIRLKAEADKRKKEQALASMYVKNDKFEGIKWYYDRATYSQYAGNKFQLYIGKRESGDPWLRLKMQYYGSDWIFWDTLEIKVDKEKYSIEPGYFEVERDNSGGNVWEWYDMSPDSYELEMIKEIIKSKSTVLRFSGKYRADRTLSQAQKKAFENVLLAFETLGG
jgi:hypothetical protein